MELKEGYKSTEVGIIPEDWQVKKLSEIGKFSKGSGVRKDEALSGNIPCVRYGELYTRHSDYIKQFYSFISNDISSTAKRLKKGDILFAGSGETKEEIGKSVAFINDFEAFAGGDIVILSPENTNSLYLGYLLNAPFIQKQKASRGQGDAVVHISSTQLGNISIPLPKEVTEQTAIATALSDADALINSLEKLINKKRNIKQGTMQKLLQPKEGWEVKKLGEIGDIITGGTPPTGVQEYWNGTIPWITPTDIGLDKNIYNSEREISEAGLNLLRKLPINTLLVTCIASIGKNAILRRKGACNQQINAIIPNEENDVDFLYYLIERNRSYILAKAGITATLLISKKDFSEIIFSFPNSKEEQTRIATILSDMDAEIQALDTKLEKYRKIKLGMMQNLLTGKIRLV